MRSTSHLLSGLVAVLSGVAACASPAAPPPAARPAAPEPAAAPAAPTSSPVDTGKDCATATARCGGGACDVDVKNDCDQAVHCALQLDATCATQTGSVAASGGGRGTIGPHEKGAFGAQATCPEGAVTHTEISKMTCK